MLPCSKHAPDIKESERASCKSGVIGFANAHALHHIYGLHSYLLAIQPSKWFTGFWVGNLYWRTRKYGETHAFLNTLLLSDVDYKLSLIQNLRDSSA